MQLKTVQWNIGGGNIRETDAQADEPRSYSHEGLQYISNELVVLQPDIVTLQETHEKSDYNQVAILADALGYKYWFNDTYADSHISEGFKLGQGVISKFPISNHKFGLFFNPHYKAEWEDGLIAMSHDKGLSSCSISVNDEVLSLHTLHAIPFRAFEIDPLSEKATPVLQDMQKKIKNNATHMLLQGDFNLNNQSLKTLLPKIFFDGTEEAIQELPTTPKGRFYDHIVYRGLKLVSTTANSGALTDHYPIISTFDLY